MMKTAAQIDVILRAIYFNPENSGAYGGADALHRQVIGVLSKKQVTDWLSGQDTYTLHKPIRRKFNRRRVLVGRVYQQWQADLVDLQSIYKINDGYKYLLTCIDVLSKYAWVVPLKNKTGKSIIDAFETIFAERKPGKLHTDKGTAFVNRPFKKYLDELNVRHFTTENDDIKACIVERFNRTLKTKMLRYFTKNSTNRYLDVLPQLTKAYNDSYHSTIKAKPSSVKTTTRKLLRNFHARPYKRRVGFTIGDHVRISKTVRAFKKGYVANWSEETFEITKIERLRPPVYTVKDYNDEELKGRFYGWELQKVAKKDVFRIEKVIKCTKGRCLVKWLGYPPSFNSWVSKKDIADYKG